MCAKCGKYIEDQKSGMITVIYGRHGHEESYHWDGDATGDSGSCFEEFAKDVASSSRTT